MKKQKSETHCNTGLKSRGGGQAEQSRVTCFSKWRVERATAKPRFRRKRERRRFTRGAVVAFTMAEILLSLTIIGVVAAITLPSLTGNINERTWNTQRKALYARFSQAIALMPALNGYGTLTEGSESTSAADTAAETFVTEGLSKVLKINNICDSEHLQDCGIPNTVTTTGNSVLSNFTSNYNTLAAFNTMFNGSYLEAGKDLYSYSQIDTKAAAFETANGESILVYYNPNCRGDSGAAVWHFSQPKMCANFVYDLNGSKGPNTAGKDIGFITALYPTDPVVVAPLPLPTDAAGGKQTDAGRICQQKDPESRMPNRDELSAMFYNRILLNIPWGYYWSSSVVSTDRAWGQYFSMGVRFPGARQDVVNIRCIKR